MVYYIFKVVNLRYKLKIVRVLGKRERERESVSKSVMPW